MSIPVPDTTSLGAPSAEERDELGQTNESPPALPVGRPARVQIGDRVFAGVVRMFGLTVLAPPALMFLALLVASAASLRRTGFGFLTSSQWDPVHEQFGAWPF